MASRVSAYTHTLTHTRITSNANSYMSSRVIGDKNGLPKKISKKENTGQKRKEQRHGRRKKRKTLNDSLVFFCLKKKIRAKRPLPSFGGVDAPSATRFRSFFFLFVAVVVVFCETFLVQQRPAVTK